MPGIVDGKIALVTGAGRGLGAAIARMLAAEGATVITSDYYYDRAMAMAAEINALGQRAVGCWMDVADPEMVGQAMNDVEDDHERLDILVNNAGTDLTRRIEDITDDDFVRIVNTNLIGPFMLCRRAFPLMGKGGHIINVCSTASKRAWANASAYHASKWGLLGLSHALHVEGRDRNIKVTAVVAGGMSTPFILDRFPDTPLDVLQSPENVASVVRFLLTVPDGTVIPEIMVVPTKETSWP